MVFRLDPQMPAASYKTYVISSPLATHFRPGTCAEAECGAHEHGWLMRVDEAAELGQRQAYYIRKQASRKHTEQRDEAGLTVFTFEAGQQCFAEHKVPLGRPEKYLVKGGDWRGNPRGTRTLVHTRPADWVDDFQNHQQGLADRLGRG